MKIDGNILTAEDGRALVRKGDQTPTTITRVALPASDSPENWEDCDYGEISDMKYYTVDILTAIGSVCGSDRYDAIKSALSLSRIGGVPVWDMLISGMYIPATDPRLAQIRAALVDAELVTGEEFDRILALAASDEPVAEDGAAE